MIGATSQDNKEPPFEFDIGRNDKADIGWGDQPEGQKRLVPQLLCWTACPCSSQLVPNLLLESQYACWNASGTCVAVTSSGHAQFLVFDMNKRRVVRHP